VREQGEKELERSFGGLAWSGLAAGLSIGFSFVVCSATARMAGPRHERMAGWTGRKSGVARL